MEHQHGDKRWAFCITLLILILVGTLVQAVLTVRLTAGLAASAVSRQAPQALPCGAIPTKLILEDPVCADKLLRAMNVTDVRILPRHAVTSGPPRQTGQLALNST